MTDTELFGVIRAFLRETPPELIDADPERWPDLFPNRLAWEAWRQRWLAYAGRFTLGPTSPAQYAQLRATLWSDPRMERVDRFHS